MSEADTPNSKPIQPSADLPRDPAPAPLFPPESVAEPANPPIPEPEPQSVLEQENPTPDINESELTVIEGTSSEDPVTVDFAQESDWFVQARKQRQRNRELVKTVAQLEQALAEAQEELQAQGVRSNSSEIIITQQAEELHSTKQQLSQLFQDLDSTHQTTQRQQLLIETLSEQLETAQQQVTVLEEECNALRELEQQQARNLQQAQLHADELAARLQSQQHQAQQFKAALDKCLESPPLRQQVDLDALPQAEEILPDLSNPDEAETPPTSPEISPLSLASPRPNPAAWGRRVQPWSLQLGQAQEDEDLSSISELSAVESLPLSSEAFSEDEVIPEVSDSEVDSLEVVTSASPDLEEDSEEDFEKDSEEVLEKDLERDEEIAIEIPAETPADDPEIVSEAEEIPEPISLDPPVSPEDLVESAFAEAQSSQKAVNWPSPTLTPVRPPKKRKSLAAVDLPSFPRFS